MDLEESIRNIESESFDPTVGLPDPLFYFVGRLTPFINVDLLIVKGNSTLLAWRDDIYCGKGWHIPGGIIRFRETIEQRIQAVAISEVGTEVILHSNEPIAVNQIIDTSKKERSHFISLLYKCTIREGFQINNGNKKPFEQGYLAWHSSCPQNILKYHNIYRKFLDRG